MQDGILPSCQRPSGLPLDDVYTNGREYGFLLDSKRSDCKLAVPSEFAFYIPCTVLSLAETRGRIPRFFLESGFYRVVCYCVACWYCEPPCRIWIGDPSLWADMLYYCTKTLHCLSICHNLSCSRHCENACYDTFGKYPQSLTRSLLMLTEFLADLDFCSTWKHSAVYLMMIRFAWFRDANEKWMQEVFYWIWFSTCITTCLSTRQLFFFGFPWLCQPLH